PAVSGGAGACRCPALKAETPERALRRGALAVAELGRNCDEPFVESANSISRSIGSSDALRSVCHY
ncbi:MAG TPA: hypothetical protein VHJ18_20555, partial [Streptosporangiaceae bacterium]|nr:hypothetical protein [Streptosporangiaceae bacterium]